jgi:AraC-like DNA-binding protein
MFQDFFPDDITILHKVTLHNEKVCKHIHENFELLFIISDGIIGTIGEKHYNLKRNTLVLLSNVDFHWFRMNTAGCFDRYVVTFMPENLATLSTNDTNLLDCFFFRPFPDSQIIELDDEQAKIIVSLFEDLMALTKPARNKVYGNNLSIILQFANILLKTNTYYREKHTLYFMNPEEKNQRAIYSVINYLHTHYFEEITLDSLAHDFEINKYKLARTFKSVTGLSPIRYLIRCRLENAKQLLRIESSVDSVCFEIGFNSLSHFSKSFKTKYGISPKSYQMKHRCDC